MLQRNLGFLKIGADPEAKIGSLDGGDATIQSANCKRLAPQTLLRLCEFEVQFLIGLSLAEELIAFVVIRV